MGLLSELWAGFKESVKKAELEEQQKRENAQQEKRLKKETLKMQKYITSVDFEDRFLRARTEPLEILEFCNETHTQAKIRNAENGHIYFVSNGICECEDYKKHLLPCKHILFLALQTNNFESYEKPIPEESFAITQETDEGFIPVYWEYYHGKPNGLGYTNLHVYEVHGFLHGISKKTGKPTRRKKTIYINAKNSEDAREAAKEKDVMPPYQVKFVDMAPSYEQYRYIRGVKIPFPNFATSLDISALLTRYEENDNRYCPDSLIKMATHYRIRVSFFSSPVTVISRIWMDIADDMKPGLFCYTAYCREFGYSFSESPIDHTNSVFWSFSPTKKQLEYIFSIAEYGYYYKSMSKRNTTYQAAIEHIKKNLPYLFC